MLTPHFIPGTSHQCSHYAREGTRCSCGQFISPTMVEGKSETEHEFNDMNARRKGEPPCTT